MLDPALRLLDVARGSRSDISATRLVLKCLGVDWLGTGSRDHHTLWLCGICTRFVDSGGL